MVRVKAVTCHRAGVGADDAYAEDHRRDREDRRQARKITVRIIRTRARSVKITIRTIWTGTGSNTTGGPA
jgi:hypothetical protein